MENILMALFSSVLKQAFGAIDWVFDNMVGIVLFPEQYMSYLKGVAAFDTLFNTFMTFGIAIIVLKFLKKGFDTYVAWTDDPSSDPFGLAVNFVKALAVAMTFPILYGWLANVIDSLTSVALKAVTGDTLISWQSITTAGALTMMHTIMITIAVIMLFMLYVQFISRGFEILILRIGVPIACLGLIDNNRGVFAGYLQKIFQSTLSVLVQLVIMKIGAALLVAGHPIWAIAAFVTAMRGPKLLNDIILLCGGGVNMGTVYHTAQLGRSIVAALKK